MRHFVWALVLIAIGVAACGGGNKPPMVPDQPDDTGLAGDGGADMPAPGAK